MADLENLLLEAAGRTNSSARNRHSNQSSRRRREGSYSDGGSDSRDDDSDDDHNYTSKKPSGSQVPLKKRLDPTDHDDDHGSQGGDYDDGGSDREGNSSDESDVGSDLYKNEDDRRKLAQMTELEREMILTDRAMKKDDKTFKEQLRLKRDNERSTKERKQTPPLPSSRGVRSSARSADRAAAKDDALNELRAKRLKQQDPEAHRKLRDAPRGSAGSRGFSPIKTRKSISARSMSSSSQSQSESESESRSHSEDEGSTGDGGMIDSDDDRGMPGSEGLTYEDIKQITIRRSRLAKWFMEPFFEELITGCFVRVGIGKSKSGPVYRLCMVKNVDASDPGKTYKLENKTTYKWLNVVWGNESNTNNTNAARWQMAMMSDAPPQEEEYKQWLREVERVGNRLPSKQDVLDKIESIKKINTFVYSAATVKQMLQEKKTSSSRPLNIAAEKDKLRRKMEVAESKGDEAEKERIQARLQELEATRQTQGTDSKAIRLAEMNRKNRVENFKNASGLKQTNTGEAGYDPFSRRWTRSTNYYVSRPGGGDAAAANGGSNGAFEGSSSNAVGASVAKEAGIAATAAALVAAADAGKLVDTNAPMDGTESNSLHNFDLPISLASLQKFGGSQGAHAGFMARKQRIEATVGCQVPENDGRRHALTLTVSDYKRRRGLL